LLHYVAVVAITPLVLWCLTVKQFGYRRVTSQTDLWLFVSLLVVVLLKAAADPDASGSEQLSALYAFGCLLVLVSARRVPRLACWARSASGTPLVIVGVCLGVFVVQESLGSYSRTAVKVAGQIAPCALALTVLRCERQSRFRLLVTALLASLPLVLQREKGPVLAAACCWLPLLWLPGFLRARTLLLATAALAVLLVLWERQLSEAGYLTIGDYVESRVVKEGRDQSRLFGIIADGGRFEMWRGSVHSLLASPWSGAPVRHMAKLHGVDEHNGWLFFATRLGVPGMLWLGLWATVFLRRFIIGRWATHERVAMLVVLLPWVVLSTTGNLFSDASPVLLLSVAAVLTLPRLTPRPLRASNTPPHEREAKTLTSTGINANRSQCDAPNATNAFDARLLP
jgi:hypothetical protein